MQSKHLNRIVIVSAAPLAAGLMLGARPPHERDDLKRDLGEQLFFTTALSNPPGQACATCHTPSTAFSDHEQGQATSNGANPDFFGPRNAPSISYVTYCPPRLAFSQEDGGYVGGIFTDGRAPSLLAQAMQPFLTHHEMDNASYEDVVHKLADTPIAPLFRTVYGEHSLDAGNEEEAFIDIADAIVEFEFDPRLAAFTSKYDYYLEGEVQLTLSEKRGVKLFNGKANCIACHQSTVQGSLRAPPPHALFTDFGFDNIGTPKNWDNKFLRMPPDINPEGRDYIDHGLRTVVEQFDPDNAYLEDGKFKTPSLRNVAVTAPYGHNGYFKTLKEVVHFYNTRDVPGAGWPPPEVPETVNHDDFGDLGLTEQEEDDIVAFLKTLTDGYRP